MFGTSGPPYVVYLSYRKLEKHVFRATLVVMFAFDYTWRLSVFIHEGLYTMTEFKFALSLIPALLIGILAGQRLHNRLNEGLFRTGISILLIISGLACFV